MALRTVTTYDGEGNMRTALVVDTTTREQIRELRDEAVRTCEQFRQWMHEFRQRLSGVTGPLYKEVIISRLLDGNVKGRGFTMISPDIAIGMFHAASYDAFDKMDEGRKVLFLYLQQAEFFAHVLEKLDEKGLLA